MNEISENQTQEELTKFDANIPENIIKLDRKLKDILHDVEIKLNDPSSYPGEDKEIYIQKLNRLYEEITDTISRLETMVSIVNSQSDEFKKEFYESAVMKEFNESVAASFAKLSE
ncbi:hypothetical protein EP47_02885 [Legionella norrlandica]|uniref:Coiled-coil protein n=1 Tax=Legionella norrlandica TaxID=1498499 RepID=A0A0A2SU45_9GAMM|nr:hypothetical protein [Legionella norrlandica]KGP63251.1 hypothetical protein EP47_02885 [Legionella norrlandica]